MEISNKIRYRFFQVLKREKATIAILCSRWMGHSNMLCLSQSCAIPISWRQPQHSYLRHYKSRMQYSISSSNKTIFLEQDKGVPSLPRRLVNRVVVEVIQWIRAFCSSISNTSSRSHPETLRLDQWQVSFTQRTSVLIQRAMQAATS